MLNPYVGALSLHSAIDFGKIAIRNHLWGLITDPNLEPSWAPVYELNGPLGFKSGDCSMDVVGHDITPVEEAGGHVLAVPGIAFYHLIVRLKAGH